MELPSNQDYLSHLAYDSVVFGFSGERLKILVMEYHNTGLFALPGGFVSKDEDLDAAVHKGLKERTGLDNIYLEQFHTFGDVARFDAGAMKRILNASGHFPDESHWMLQRFITVAYYALINYRDLELKPDDLSDSIKWYPLNELPPLMMDHSKIVNKAMEVLKVNLERKLVGVNLLPEKFTMNELQNVNEAILDKKLRRTSFQRKMLSMDVLKRHEKRYSGGSHKAPYLYSFKFKSNGRSIKLNNNE